MLRQGGVSPLGLAIGAGSDYRDAVGLTDCWSHFVELIAARRLGSFLDLFVVPMYASDTRTLTHASNVGLGASIQLPHAWDLEGEVIPKNRDYKYNAMAWSVALNKRIRGHAFLFYFSDSRATTDLLVGSDLPGGFERNDVRMGFNLIRRCPE